MSAQTNDEGEVMDTPEKRIARAEKLDRDTLAEWHACTCGKCGLLWSGGEMHIATVESEHEDSECQQPSTEQRQKILRFMEESRTLLSALAADAKRAQGELCEISAAWEAEHSQGGIEPGPALTCMLQALLLIREQKRGTEHGFRTLIEQRDQALARAEKSELDRAALVEQIAQKNREAQLLVSALKSAASECEQHNADYHHTTHFNLIEGWKKLCTI